MTTQNISLDATLKTGSTGSTGGQQRPRRLTKKQRRDMAWKRITELHIEWKERKQNQQL